MTDSAELRAENPSTGTSDAVVAGTQLVSLSDSQIKRAIHEGTIAAERIAARRGITDYSILVSVVVNDNRTFHFHEQVGRVMSNETGHRISSSKIGAVGGIVSGGGSGGNATNYGDVAESIQKSTTSIQQGDIHSLRQYLSSQGIADSDLNELEQAIEDDPKPTEDKPLGNGVLGWIGKMVMKAGSTAWQIGKDVAADVLGAALRKFYGLP